MGTYASNLARHLVALPAQHEYVFYVEESEGGSERDLESDHSSVVRVHPGPLPGRAARVWASVRRPTPAGVPLDLMFQTDLALAPPAAAPTVGFVHDLIPLVIGETRPTRDWPLAERLLVRTAGAWVYRRSLRRLVDALHLVTNSEHTRREVLAQFPQLDERRVSVTHLAADPLFVPVDPAATLGELAIAGPYVLYVGGADPRKNVRALVSAFELARSSHPELLLVLVGNEFRDPRIARKHAPLFKALESSPASDAIVRPGYVDLPDLRALYSGAVCFVMPSLHEGFGIPAVEAMQCRCPVVAGANSAQAEVVGDAGLLVSPEPDALAAAITTLVEDEDLRRRMQARGQARAADFSWERTARETERILEAVVRAHPR